MKDLRVVGVLITTNVKTLDMAPNFSRTIMHVASEVGEEAAARETLLANMARGVIGRIDVTARHHRMTPILSTRCTLETATMDEVILVAISVISLAAVAAVTETPACSTKDDLLET